MSKTWEFNLNKTRKNLQEPLGYTRNYGDVGDAEVRPQNLKEAWEKKVKTFAMSPASSILMVLFMMWMQGGGLNIFTIFLCSKFSLDR